MKFYRLTTDGMFSYSKKSYAYLSVNKTNKVPDNYKGPVEEYPICKCPYCGFERIHLFRPEKNIAVFCKDKVGDISMGVHDYGQISFSQKFLDMIDKYGLKGIVDDKKYLFMETSRHQPITSIEGDYYGALIHFEPLVWKYINKIEKSDLTKRPEKVGCNKCISPYMAFYDKDAKVYLQGLKSVEFDIFSTIDSGGEVIFSERFVEACKKENITNLLDRIVEVYDIEDLTT